MIICFDMDGTIADLFSVENWLPKLEASDPTPYAEAAPMWNMEELAEVLESLAAEIRIVSWLSKDSTEAYKQEVREAKKDWLARMGFPYDHFHGVQYGTTKANCVRRYLSEGEEAILIDDNAKVREGWHLGRTVDPTAENIIDFLRSLLEED